MCYPCVYSFYATDEVCSEVAVCYNEDDLKALGITVFGLSSLQLLGFDFV